MIKLKNRKIVLSCLLVIFSALVISCKKEKKDPPKDPLPDAAFTYTSVRKLPVSVAFNNTSVSDTIGATYVWDFGDGSTSTRPNPSHEYLQAGVYAVRLVQTELNGNKDSVIKLITIPQAGNGPSGISSRLTNISVADFTFNILVAHTVTFTNKSNSSNVYLWDFGDGLTSNSPAATVTHDYLGTGPFIVKLKAAGTGGTDSCKATLNF